MRYLLTELDHSGTVRRVRCDDPLVDHTFTCGLLRTNFSLQHAWLLELVKRTPSAASANDIAMRSGFMSLPSGRQRR
jgi:hypothetical protein